MRSHEGRRAPLLHHVFTTTAFTPHTMAHSPHPTPQHPSIHTHTYTHSSTCMWLQDPPTARAKESNICFKKTILVDHDSQVGSNSLSSLISILTPDAILVGHDRTNTHSFALSHEGMNNQLPLSLSLSQANDQTHTLFPSLSRANNQNTKQ